MKILLVSEFFPKGKNLNFSGGVETRTFFIAKYLAKKNKVSIICSRQKGTKKFEKMFNFSVYRVGPERKYNATVGSFPDRIKFMREAIKIGRSFDVDIIDGGNFIAHFIAKMIANYKKIPVVAWYPDVWVGSWFKNAGIRGIFGEILERINLIFNFDAYIAISKTTAQKLKKRVNKKINIIPCGVDEQEFKVPIKKFPQPTIICISRLTRYKNLKTLIFAFAHLTIQVKRARLIIIGEGPEYNNLKNLVKNLRISLKVKFASNLKRKDLIKLIKQSHIFSLSSLVEGFGISTLEAASAGIPYVISDIAVHREITYGAKGGFLVGPQEPSVFSKRFYELFSDKLLYSKKSKQAKELAKNYDWNTITRSTEKVYLSLI